MTRPHCMSVFFYSAWLADSFLFWLIRIWNEFAMVIITFPLMVKNAINFHLCWCSNSFESFTSFFLPLITNIVYNMDIYAIFALVPCFCLPIKSSHITGKQPVGTFAHDNVYFVVSNPCTLLHFRSCTTCSIKVCRFWVLLHFCAPNIAKNIDSVDVQE